MIEYIKNTFYGKTSFVDTLIFFGVFGISFFIVLFISLSEHYAYYLVTHKYILYILLISVIVYIIFLSLSLYRSSKNHKKICFITIGLEIAIISLLISYFLSTVYNPNKIFESAILSINNNLPKMIEKDIRLDKITIENDNILYNYTILKSNEKYINKDLFTLVMMDKIKRNSDIDKMFLKLSKKKREIKYIFRDKNSNLITKVNLKLF